MRTNLSGRVKNTSLPSTHALMPLFEAVMNSIHSIEDIGNDFSSSRITVSIIRSDQALLSLEKDTEKPKEIVGFKIIDNGTGFNDHNLQSFETLDSDNKKEKGCRGVGRLLWLKAFDDIKIKSVYEKDKELKGREFSFDANKGIKALRNFQDDCAKKETVVELKGLKKNYKNHIPKTLKSISKALLEHFLWYFARTGSCPSITIEDGSEKISLNKLYEECKLGAIVNEEIKIEDHNFSIMHIKFRNLSVTKQTLSFCAANRVIKEEAISKKILGMPSKLQDDMGEFIYSCYVSSPFLDERVRSERISFDIEENTEGLFEEIEISFNMIRNAIVDRIQKYLAKELENNVRDSKERVEKFTHKVPRYRPLLKHLTDNDYMISSTKDDKGLELHLHECFAKLENKILKESHNVLEIQKGEDKEQYLARIGEYVNTVSDLKKSDLADYLCHRKVIIELFKESLKSLSTDDKKRYVKENVIHQLIVPMKCDSDSVSMNNCNLWLIDEKLAFHDYLASDLSLSKIPFTGSKDKDRPDICGLEVYDKAPEVYDKALLVSEKKGDSISSTLASLTIVEIKRPMRNDAKTGNRDDPIEQVVTYLEKIREGQVQTTEGRPINLDGEVPGYCYVICDLTEKIKNVVNVGI